MQFFYVFIGLIAVVSATKNVTDSNKDKRQIGHEHTAVIPIGNSRGAQAVIIQQNPHAQPSYGRQVAGQYISGGKSTQPSPPPPPSPNSDGPQQEEIPPEYYNYIQGLVAQQQQQHQQQQAAAANGQPQIIHQIPREQPEQQTQYVQSPQHRFVPQSQANQPLQHSRPLTEAEYQELVKKTEEQNAAIAAQSQKYALSQAQSVQESQPVALGLYKKDPKETQQQQQIHPIQHVQPIQQIQQAQPAHQQIQPAHHQGRAHAAHSNPQSYRQAYINPLGDFSLEKELAKLEESNRAVENENAQHRQHFRPSQQIVVQQQSNVKPQYSFIPAETPQQYIQYGGGQAEKLVAPQYTSEDAPIERPAAKPEYKIQYSAQTESPNKYLPEPETKERAIIPSAKYQYYVAGDQVSQHIPQQLHIAQPQQVPQQHPQQIRLPIQVPYQSPKPIILSPQQSQIKSNANKLVKNTAQIQYEKSESSVPSPKPQLAFKPIKSQPPQVQSSPSHSTIFVSQGTGLHQQQQQQTTPASKKDKSQVRLPPPNSKRPLTQAEFQALVDAGYKVQAIPVPVPVPVSSAEYAQLQQQQQQHNLQHQQQPVQYIQQQQPQQHHPQQHSSQQQQYHARPQPSTKHFVRYQAQPSPGATDDNVLSSYLRPIMDQYHSIMGGRSST